MHIEATASMFLRLMHFYRAAVGKAPAAKNIVKRDAWCLKKFAVLVKRKLARGQIPRNSVFSSFLSILDNEDADMNNNCDYHVEECGTLLKFL